jgi:hypothetical protein
MKKQEVRDIFTEQLVPFLPGFRLRKKDGSFVRAIPGGVQTIGLSIVDYNPEFKVSLVFTVRLEEVEKISHELLQTPERYRNVTITTATVLEHFFPGEGPQEFTVTTSDDIAAVVRGLGPHLRDRIVPFFERHQNVASLDAVVNSEEGASFVRTNAPYRQMRALILAHLANNPRFDDLARQFEEQSHAWHPGDREHLLATIRYLSARA